MNLVNNILSQTSPYILDRDTKSKYFLNGLRNLISHHYSNSTEFRNFINNNNLGPEFNAIDELPYLPARIFKLLDLKSIDDKDIFKVMTSSGTSGQAVSKIFLDKSSSMIQTKVLNQIISFYIGKKRRNMLIIDSESIIKDRKNFNARAAGILGFSSFGRNHSYILDSDLSLDLAKLKEALQKNNGQPLLIFGFTFLVWQKFVQTLMSIDENILFPEDTILIHGGGWKRLIDQSVDNKTFKSNLRNLGVYKVHDYYGMIEQTGSIFFECNEGYLHCSDYSDVICRDASNLNNLGFSKEGILQVLSLLPTSYPGNSILTEDMATIFGEDNCSCGKMGKFFKISGRMKQSEIRGCSDTRAL